jgi:hypothetical protein
MLIDRWFILSLHPCKCRLVNYINHYKDWSGTWSEFLELEHITTADKLWVFSQRISGIQPEQRLFALICADIAVGKSDKIELKEFLNLQASIVEGGLYSLINYRKSESLQYRDDRSIYYGIRNNTYHIAHDRYSCSMYVDVYAYLITSHLTKRIASEVVACIVFVARCNISRQNEQLEIVKSVMVGV